MKLGVANGCILPIGGVSTEESVTKGVTQSTFRY